jgi:ActR/RegA family two-component response regulator
MDKKKILIVDDQAVYLQSLEFVLSKRFDVITAKSKEEAISSLEKVSFDIALLDIRLSENDSTNNDGLRILEWIQMHKQGISVFVMSAYSEFSYAETALNLGAKHFFKKPIDIASLIAIIGEKA